MTDETNRGYKRPPKDTRFKPGTSGNPRGRKKGSRNLRTDLKQMMRKFVAIREDGKRKRITRQQAMLLSLFEKALRGDVKAATAMINMVIKLDPTSNMDPAADERLSDTDAEIVADFLRRNQPINS
jgi:hypothetical protein